MVTIASHEITIPEAQAVRIRQVQDTFWSALDDSLDELDASVAKRFRKSMAKIRASGFNEAVIRRETKAILRHTNDVTTQLLAGQVQAAAEYAQRAADVTRAWQIAGRLKEGVSHLNVSASAYARANRPGVAGIDAQAAVARIKFARLRTPRAANAAFARYGARVQLADYNGPMTSGMRVLKKLRAMGLVKRSQEIGLSARLHGSLAYNTKLTEKAIGTAIREAHGLNKAARDLVNVSKQAGEPLSVKAKLTGPLKRLQQAGRNLQHLSINQGDPDAIKEATAEFNRKFETVKRAAGKLVDSRGGYKEFIQIAEKQGVDGMDKALSRWLDEKQASHAERIIETETAAAYRAREYAQHVGKPYVVGFWWRRNPGMASLDKRRRKDALRVRRSLRAGRKAKRKVAGAPCRVCPELADKRFPVEYAREFPRGAHPNCRCWYEWIYNTGALANSPLTQADLDWYAALPD